jgi:branched-chain amino acid transport system permease protein
LDLTALGNCFLSPACLVTQSAAGLIAGILLFLVASGLTLIFGVLGFVNFIHGSFYMLGAYFAYTAYKTTGSFAAAVFGGALGVACVGVLVERIVIKRIYEADVLLQILVCYAFILIFDDVVTYVWGAEFIAMGMPETFRLRPLFVLGGVVPPFYLFLIGITVAITAGIIVVLRYTRYGKIIRAAAQNRQMVSALGINTDLIYVSVFALGASLAGAAGALAAPVRSLTSGMGFGILIESFIVTVIGGMGSVFGAFIASLIIGLTRSFGSIGFPLFTDGLIFVLMALILLLRPQGLFGHREREI